MTYGIWTWFEFVLGSIRTFVESTFFSVFGYILLAHVCIIACVYLIRYLVSLRRM